MTTYVSPLGIMVPLPNVAQAGQKPISPIPLTGRTVIPPQPLPSGTANTTLGIPI
jgi:hypothetical protein